MEAEEADGLLRRIVRRYYGFQIFFALLFWVPVYYDFQRRIGLSDPQIFRIQSVYYLAFCLLEIPTGYVADRWGHLRCMRAGGFILVLSSALPAVLPTYEGMLGHFLLLALARSFISGASSAYVYGALGELGDTGTFKVIEGRARAYGLVAKVLSWGVVGWMMQWHLAMPYWATTGASLIAVGYAFSLPPLGVVSAAAPRLALSPAFRALVKHPMLTLVMVQGISVFVLGRIVQVNLFQPILGEKGFPVTSYGVVMGGMAIFEALGSGYPHTVRRYLSDLNAVFVFTLIMAGTLSAIALSGMAGTAVALAVFALVGGLSFPIQRQLLNDTIPDARYRATLMSMESIVDRAVNAWVASLLAAYVSTGRTGAFLQLSAAVTVGLLFVLFIAMRVRRARA
jgi:MFS family permease